MIRPHETGIASSPKPSTLNGPDLLQVDSVSRRYRVREPGRLLAPPAMLHAVSDVSFRLSRGRTLSLVGESGCGKSTTAKLTLGLIEPSSGTVHFDGQAIARRGSQAWRASRRHMQMVYQDPLAALDRRMTIGDQIAEPMIVFGLADAGGRRARVEALLHEVGLGPAMQHRFAHELSGGQRQRAVLARALAVEPRLLVCDEPISALDVSIQAQVINLLGDLQQSRDLAILFISHDLKVVRHISDQVAVMYLGRIVEQADPDRLFSAPQHPYTQALISAIPSFSTRPGGSSAGRVRLDGDPPNPMALPTGCSFHPRCPIAQAACRHTRPALAEVASGHQVACLRVGVPIQGPHDLRVSRPAQ